MGRTAVKFQETENRRPAAGRVSGAEHRPPAPLREAVKMSGEVPAVKSNMDKAPRSRMRSSDGCSKLKKVLQDSIRINRRPAAFRDMDGHIPC